MPSQVMGSEGQAPRLPEAFLIPSPVIFLLDPAPRQEGGCVMSPELGRRSVVGGLLGLAGLIVARPSLARPPAAVPLFDFAIAGGGHHGLGEARPGLALGTRMRLVAEFSNPFDANAVAVLRADGLRLGYVPRAANPPVAALLRQGRQLGAELIGWLGYDSWDDDTLATTFHLNGDPRWRLELEG